MRIFSQKDCDQTGYGFSLKDKVVVLPKSVLPENHPGQLFFCMEDNGANPNHSDKSVFLVSLSTGEQHQFWRSDVIGTLKPERLPDDAKLQLSQLRPSGSFALPSNEPLFSGYSFLPDGRYAAGVWLCSPEEVWNYVEMQKPYQHRVLICDQDDFAVLEVITGQIIFPSQEDIEAFSQEQTSGGMELN